MCNKLVASFLHVYNWDTASIRGCCSVSSRQQYLFGRPTHTDGFYFKHCVYHPSASVIIWQLGLSFYVIQCYWHCNLLMAAVWLDQTRVWAWVPTSCMPLLSCKSDLPVKRSLGGGIPEPFFHSTKILRSSYGAAWHLPFVQRTYRHQTQPFKLAINFRLLLLHYGDGFASCFPCGLSTFFSLHYYTCSDGELHDCYMSSYFESNN